MALKKSPQARFRAFAAGVPTLPTSLMATSHNPTPKGSMKLTPNQQRVLSAVKAGQVYRSERGVDLYACYDKTAWPHRKVTSIIDRLYKASFVRIGDQAQLQRPLLITEEGLRALEEYKHVE